MIEESKMFELRGFDVEYPSGFTDFLNCVYGHRINRGVLKKAGGKVFGNCRSFNWIRTSDGYDWYCALKFKIGKFNLAVLFPWFDKFGNLEQPISVYSDKVFDGKLVNLLLDGFAIEIEKLA